MTSAAFIGTRSIRRPRRCAPFVPVMPTSSVRWTRPPTVAPVADRPPATEGERVEALRVMGLPRSAPLALIRQRYRRLARELHPDHNPDDEGKTRRFREIASA